MPASAVPLRVPHDGRLAAAPFGYPYVQGLWSDWRAEEARCNRQPAVDLWAAAADRWDETGRPHRAAYAQWREAEQLLNAGQRSTAKPVLQQAWQQAGEHVPLRFAIANLARLARISLEPTDEATAEPAVLAPPPHNLTRRELDVLRLLTQGKANRQIGTVLFISPKTASVHVSAVLRKLGATNRVHAAAMDQRAGLGGNTRLPE